MGECPQDSPLVEEVAQQPSRNQGAPGGRARGFETGAGAPSSTTEPPTGGVETGAGAPSSTTEPPPRRVRIIGIGSGHPDQVTLEAAAAIASVDFVIAASKQDDDALLEARREICRRHGDPEVVAVADPPRDRADPADYTGAVADWHDARAAAYEKVLLERDGDAAFLVWGDPAFYDSTIRIVERILARGNVVFEYDVLPGLSSLQVLAAAHRMVLHEVGRPILVTTGRRLREAVDAGHDNIVVMLDGGLACRDIATKGWRIWWGANLGTPEQALVAGPLHEVLPTIEAARADARTASGWVMDTYLLRQA